MKLLKQELKKDHNRLQGTLVVIPEVVDDLWYIHRVVHEKDLVKSKTYRSFKPTEGSKADKKPVTILLEVEKKEFSDYSKSLRFTGKIIDGYPLEYIQKGSYHTLDISTNDTLSINKKWLKTQVELIKEAVKSSDKPNVLMVVLDEEKALFAKVKPRGIKYNYEITSNASKRDGNYESAIKGYFTKIIDPLLRFEGPIVIGGPGFAKDQLKNRINKDHHDLKDRIIYESCSHAERNGVQELIKRGVIDRIVGKTRLNHEEELLEEFKKHIGKDTGKVVYGLKHVKKALEYNLIKKMIVLDSLLSKSEVRDLISEAEQKNIKIVFVSDDDGPGQQFKGFTGIIAFLHYPMKDF